MVMLQRARHFKYVIQLQDEYAQLINPRAVRSSVAVIEEQVCQPAAISFGQSWWRLQSVEP
jgi:hypothetical protein